MFENSETLEQQDVWQILPSVYFYGTEYETSV